MKFRQRCGDCGFRRVGGRFITGVRGSRHEVRHPGHELVEERVHPKGLGPISNRRRIKELVKGLLADLRQREIDSRIRNGTVEAEGVTMAQGVPTVHRLMAEVKLGWHSRLAVQKLRGE